MVERDSKRHALRRTDVADGEDALFACAEESLSRSSRTERPVVASDREMTMGVDQPGQGELTWEALGARDRVRRQAAVGDPDVPGVSRWQDDRWKPPLLAHVVQLWRASAGGIRGLTATDWGENGLREIIRRQSRADPRPASRSRAAGEARRGQLDPYPWSETYRFGSRAGAL
jgi:hypothetical protein